MKQKLQALLLASASLLLMAGPLKAVERWNSFTPPPAMPAAARSGYAPAGGIRMYYAIYGEGDPILLVTA